MPKVDIRDLLGEHESGFEELTMLIVFLQEIHTVDQRVEQI